MKKIEYKKQIAILLACISMLVFGGCSLYINGGITYASLIASFVSVGPAVIIMFVMGWLIGSMMEGSKSLKKANSLNYTNSLLEEIMKEEGLDNVGNSPDLELTEEEQRELENLKLETQNNKEEQEQE